MSTEQTIEVPPRRVLGVYECPDCCKQTVARTRYKVGEINISEDDIVNPAMPDNECPECGSTENWALQAEPVDVDEREVWERAGENDWSLKRVYEEAGGGMTPFGGKDE